MTAVGVIMGSDSDWPTMKAAADALDEFGVGYEIGVVSAHRTPVAMIEYARMAAERGLRVCEHRGPVDVQHEAEQQLRVEPGRFRTGGGQSLGRAAQDLRDGHPGFDRLTAGSSR